MRSDWWVCLGTLVICVRLQTIAGALLHSFDKAVGIEVSTSVECKHGLNGCSIGSGCQLLESLYSESEKLLAAYRSVVPDSGSTLSTTAGMVARVGVWACERANTN